MASENEFAEVAKVICEDYILHKLLIKKISRRKKKHYTKAGYDEYSQYFIQAGYVLEKLYPNVYNDVSRKISTTMKSSTLVKSSLSSVLEILFRDSITWGKVVSMFAISSSFAEECVQQGHSEFLDDIIECVGKFVSLHLVEWLSKQGGWGQFEKIVVENNDVKVAVVVGVSALFMVLLTTCYLAWN